MTESIALYPRIASTVPWASPNWIILHRTTLPLKERRTFRCRICSDWRNLKRRTPNPYSSCCIGTMMEMGSRRHNRYWSKQEKTRQLQWSSSRSLAMRLKMNGLSSLVKSKASPSPQQMQWIYHHIRGCVDCIVIMSSSGCVFLHVWGHPSDSDRPGWESSGQICCTREVKGMDDSGDIMISKILWEKIAFLT